MVLLSLSSYPVYTSTELEQTEVFHLKIAGATFHLPYNLKAHLIRQNKIIYQMVPFHQLSPHNGAQNAGLFVI